MYTGTWLLLLLSRWRESIDAFVTDVMLQIWRRRLEHHPYPSIVSQTSWLTSQLTADCWQNLDSDCLLNVSCQLRAADWLLQPCTVE